MDPFFLTVEDAVQFHEDLIRRYGGRPGLRDLPALESALSQPRATFRGKFLHADLYLMAAAYLFHIVQDHPFVDGNKRAGLYAALAFLEINGVEIVASPVEVAEMVLRVAKGLLSKNEVAEYLQSHAQTGRQ